MKIINLWTTGIFLFVCFICIQTALFGDEGNVIFSTDHIRIYFQPRIRAILIENRILKDEVARLNLFANIFENYVGYLIKLKKISPETILNLEYNPDGVEEPEVTGNRYLIRDLGINSVLGTVNSILGKQPEVKKSFLVIDRNSLANIRDQLPRKKETVESDRAFFNISMNLKSIEPEVDFSLVTDEEAVAIRPIENANQIVVLPLKGSGEILLPPVKDGEFGNPIPSFDGKFLAFSQPGNIMVMDRALKKVVPVFSGSKVNLLDMAWAPKRVLLAGIAIDRVSLERKIFIFNAEKGESLSVLDNQSDVSGDYQYAYPYWSENGKRVIFCSGDEIHVVDLEGGKIFPKVVSTKGGISEILWAPDEKSFAYVDVFGQSREKHEFMDRDFSNCSLHILRFNSSSQWEEDLSQKYISSSTIKLGAFWTLNRLLFLEGKLHSQKIASPLWDLSKVFSARLSPEPTSAGSPTYGKVGPTDLPLFYCYVYKNMDNKFKNVYDSGYGGTNFLYLDKIVNSWFVGLNVPEGVSRENETYCLRPNPYPFCERNRFFLLTGPKQQIKSVLDMFRTSNIRKFEVSRDHKILWFLSNSPGPLSLWAGRLDEVCDSRIGAPPPDEIPEGGPVENASGTEFQEGESAKFSVDEDLSEPLPQEETESTIKPAQSGIKSSLPDFPRAASSSGVIMGLPDLPKQ